MRNEVTSKMKWYDFRTISNPSNLMDLIYQYVFPCEVEVCHKGVEELNVKNSVHFVCIYKVEISMWFWAFKMILLWIIMSLGLFTLLTIQMSSMKLQMMGKWIQRNRKHIQNEITIKQKRRYRYKTVQVKWLVCRKCTKT